MRGAIVKRGKSCSVVLDVGPRPADRQTPAKVARRYRTKREADAALAQLVGNVNRGTYMAKTRLTLAQFAAEWLAAIEPTVRPATHYSYARNLRLHVLPYIGSVPLIALDGCTLNGLYAGRSPGGARIWRAAGCRHDPWATCTRSCTASSKMR